MGCCVIQSEKMIEGVRLADLRQIVDERGSVLHFMRCDEKYFSRFGECYFSEISPGVVKAWKCHRIQTQNFTVPAGRILLVIYDDRKASPTEGAVMKLELGRPDAYIRVTIPPCLWYGFASISEAPSLLANCADYPHDPFDCKTLPLDDPKIPYDWAGVLA